MQVVGRAHKGLDILQKLNEAAVDPDDLPLQPVMVTACGLSDSEARSFATPLSHSVGSTPLIRITLPIACTSSSGVQLGDRGHLQQHSSCSALLLSRG